MSLHNDKIAEVSSRIAEKVLTQVKPKVLQEFGIARISDLAFHPPDFLGPIDEGLVQASKILQIVAYAIRNAIETRGEEVVKASTLDTVLSIVLSEVKSQATRLRGTRDAQSIAEGLSEVIKEHPSQLDAIAAVAVPPFSTKEDEVNNSLRKTVVQVINRSKSFMGSGFAIDNKLHILTAYHVVEDGEEFEVVFDGIPNGPVWSGSARIVSSFPAQDLSILELYDSTRAADAGLVPCDLGCTPAEQLVGHQVLGLGYHAEAYANGNGILDPCPTLARVVQQLPVRRVAFGGFEQPCLITVVESGQETIRKGMSGGPFLDLRSNEVIALITGAQAARVKQFTGRYEELPAVEYGFGVLFAGVKESWPEFAKYCT